MGREIKKKIEKEAPNAGRGRYLPLQLVFPDSVQNIHKIINIFRG
jgi:hypothetical protein